MIIEDITIRLGERLLLRDLSAVLAPGSMSALVGPSGSGKSTLLNVIAGLQRPTSGRVVYEQAMGPQNVALISQNPLVLARRTVRDNVALGALASGKEYEQAVEVADRLLGRLHLNGLANQQAFRMSGGERQRVAILRAMAQDSPVVLADEPTSSLDPQSRRAIVDTLRLAADAGAVVVVATHDANVAEACDQQLAPWAAA